MSFLSTTSLMRHVTILSTAVLFAAGSASAQFAAPANASIAASPSAGESSSTAWELVADNTGSADAMPAAEGAAAAGQGGGYQSDSFKSHLTFAVGGGFNGPTSESSHYITWGGNLNLGAGYKFNQHLSTLIEYQFIADKLPGALIAQTGATGGHAHIWSFTLAPVIDLFPTHTNDLYVTGGGGFYRKVTSFTDPMPTQYCTYFYCGIGYTNQVVGHFSSNQGGWNVGTGFTHRMGGQYGESRMKLFAEVRYLDVLTPAVTTSPNGLGVTTVGANTRLIPVTFGVRW